MHYGPLSDSSSSSDASSAAVLLASLPTVDLTDFGFLGSRTDFGRFEGFLTVEAVPFFFFAADVEPAIEGAGSVVSAVSVEGKGVEDLKAGTASE